MSPQFQDPKQEFDHSCLSKPSKVQHLHRVVHGNLRNRMGGDAAPVHGVEVLVKDIHDGIKCKRWFDALVACAILAELVYCTLHKSGTKSTYELPRRLKSRDADHEPLVALRDTCFHPALVTRRNKKKPLPMVRLIVAIRKTDRELADNLHGDWSLLRGPGVLAWCMRQLDQAMSHDVR